MVFESVAAEFDRLTEDQYRGYKGACASAAILMFLLSDATQRQAFVDLVKLSEGRGIEGTILEAARAEFARQSQGSTARTEIGRRLEHLFQSRLEEQEREKQSKKKDA